MHSSTTKQDEIPKLGQKEHVKSTEERKDQIIDKMMNENSTKQNLVLENNETVEKDKSINGSVKLDKSGLDESKLPLTSNNSPSKGKQ